MDVAETSLLSLQAHLLILCNTKVSLERIAKTREIKTHAKLADRRTRLFLTMSMAHVIL